jgi:hypothetical protein
VFPKGPLEDPKSEKFLMAVKNDNYLLLKELLKENRFLINEYDNVSYTFHLSWD